jgi:uncharacterized DUF497 family protein
VLHWGSVKYFTWDDSKNEKLKADRGIGFEEIVFLIGQGQYGIANSIRRGQEVEPRRAEEVSGNGVLLEGSRT